MYPVSEYDGKMKTTDWANLPESCRNLQQPRKKRSGCSPRKIRGRAAARSSRDAPPLPGEEARYAQVLAVVAAARNNSAT